MIASNRTVFTHEHFTYFRHCLPHTRLGVVQYRTHSDRRNKQNSRLEELLKVLFGQDTSNNVYKVTSQQMLKSARCILK